MRVLHGACVFVYIILYYYYYYRDDLCVGVVYYVLQVAVDEAKLGTMEELVECVRCADVLKPAHATAAELLSIVSGEEGKTGK